MYRMKQNAVGLANICILSTGVLLVLSTTVSIYSGVLDIIHTSYPWEISIHGENQTKENFDTPLLAAGSLIVVYLTVYLITARSYYRIVSSR